MDETEFARWSRAVLALLSRAPGSFSAEEIAADMGDCDVRTLDAVLAEMASRGLIALDSGSPVENGAAFWRPR